MRVELIGYHHSVYLRIARAVLREKGVPFGHVEVDPFGVVPEWYRALHPFGRVPVLRHGDFTVYETAAIGRYVDAAFAGPRLVPEGAREAARMQQVIGIVDSYGYWPMVRQVYSHAVFRPRMGGVGDPAEVAAGLAASARVLGALEGLVAGEWMVGERVSLADLHLGPMMAYFTAAPEGAAMLAGFSKLAGWWGRVRGRGSVVGSGVMG
jgi:glutathione S-transferase